MNKNITKSFIIGATSLALAACNAPTPTQPGTETQANVPSIFDQTLVPQENKQQAPNTLLGGNPLLPETAYAEITDGEKLVYLYYGLSQLPVDYQEIANSTVRDFRYERDEFKKRDILNALKPKIDADIKAAGAQRYLKFRANDTGLYSEYDFNKKAFKQNAIGPGTRFSFGDVGQKIAFTNATSFEWIPVPDESQARQLTAMRSKYDGITLDIYLFAQEADLNEKAIRCQIMKMVYKTKDGLEIVVK